jgi:methanogenic corrinoid protein MtbC1
MDGNVAAALGASRRPLETTEARQIRVVAALERAMDLMSDKCTSAQFNLLEIMLTGRAAMAVVRDAFPEGTARSTKGTVVIATPEGDVHDLGKNITRMVLTAKGFRVVDCGKDCPLPVMIQAVQQDAAFALLVSGLISPVASLVRQLRGKLREAGLSGVKLVAGGAALKQCTAESLNVDHVAEDAFTCVRYLEALRGHSA